MNQCRNDAGSTQRRRPFARSERKRNGNNNGGNARRSARSRILTNHGVGKLLAVGAEAAGECWNLCEQRLQKQKNGE